MAARCATPSRALSGRAASSSTSSPSTASTREKLRYVPNFFESADDAPVAAGEVAALRQARGRHILYFGRLSPEKGVDVLIDAAAAADAPLTIVGDGPQREALEAQARALGAPLPVHRPPQRRGAVGRGRGGDRGRAALPMVRDRAQERARGAGARQAGHHDAHRRPAGTGRTRRDRPSRRAWRSPAPWLRRCGARWRWTKVRWPRWARKAASRRRPVSPAIATTAK